MIILGRDDEKAVCLSYLVAPALNSFMFVLLLFVARRDRLVEKRHLIVTQVEKLRAHVTALLQFAENQFPASR